MVRVAKETAVGTAVKEYLVQRVQLDTVPHTAARESAVVQAVMVSTAGFTAKANSALQIVKVIELPKAHVELRLPPPPPPLVLWRFRRALLVLTGSNLPPTNCL